jgi:hypothetical protein
MSTSTVLPFIVESADGLRQLDNNGPQRAPNRWGEYLAYLAQAQDPPKPAVLARASHAVPVESGHPHPVTAENSRPWA